MNKSFEKDKNSLYCLLYTLFNQNRACITSYSTLFLEKKLAELYFCVISYYHNIYKFNHAYLKKNKNTQL